MNIEPCPICGKTKDVGQVITVIYNRLQNAYFCSNCLIEFKNGKIAPKFYEKKKTTKREPKKGSMKEKVFRLFKKGLNDKEIIKQTGYNKKTVQRYIREFKDGVEIVKSKKEIAFELFEEGLDKENVMKKADIAESTYSSYKNMYERLKGA